ncbi:uncharacterized protein LOC132280129 [Cornus florida]|uniref:uncharacterized protein LOC132280129 n=1 Tax=Cornus florida TaxID=4283 RepID=UPI0028981161|nr:uncharacterized protein LOC132280129 [Cornus florida]
MEVMVPVQAMDFNGGLRSPPSPKRFGEYYFSAPNSPKHFSGLYHDFDDFAVINNSSARSSAAVPFDWEEKPGTPKSSKPSIIKNEDDFAFDVSQELDNLSVSAEELFDGGKIRPLKLPPQSLLHKRIDESATQKSPVRSPISHGKKIIKEAFSPRRKKGIDPFAAAAESTCKRAEHERGRERSSVSPSPSSAHRGTRSLSPFRVSKYPWEEQEQQQQLHNTKQSSSSIIPKPSLSSTTSSLSSSSSKGYKKWRLKDFCLFRNASEGRAMDRYPLKKYAALFKKHEDIKNASFRSLEGSYSGSSSNRRGPVSAHELHYTVNRAVSEDMKKKTFLPYKQGILGRLAFNPTVHALANGFGFSRG